ncbi:PREDICTED: uncharacterized protein At3g61260-like isoform X1 [Populus euphratica]|uniref:Uncharacterized protein At3g61260-like isoform X1 n=1 Tax=Populus euphratica TaxID=75702 RepID=A0AAJ6TVZ6_POPEU|nr:PREDICTED: uncharacterized protein At3g61260-like isoform X1 [Populus euphratica]XP_011018185.1 PREDICTED: uncharacterized protein At3g61260-like isoform X1 [Populus euphratica]
MENLLKQVRVRFFGQENSEGPQSARERTPSLKEVGFAEIKRPQNWFQRQFSGQMNKDYDSSGIEHVTAVVAAVYAIASSNAPGIQEQGRISKGPEPSLTQIKSEMKESTDLMSEPGEGSMRSPESDPRIKRILTSTESPKRQNSKVPETAIKEKTTSDDAAAAPQFKRTLTVTDKPAPSMKKTPTFADKSLSSTKDMKPESAEPITDVPTTRPRITAPKPDQPPTSKPATPAAKIERKVSTTPGIDGTNADAWERAELSKIQKRYEKTNARILSWENKKKEKARNRLKKTDQNDSKGIRSKAFKKFHAEMADIDQIAGAAKAKAAERQRNEELRVKGKANTIRKTGKLPRTCFCF